jgi:hypothetical protein
VDLSERKPKRIAHEKPLVLSVGRKVATVID